MKKYCITLLTITMLASLFVLPTSAETVAPYDNYTYFENNSSVSVGPQAYIPELEIFGTSLGVGELAHPTDMEADENGNLYILDNGNNRIVVIDSSFKLVNVFDCTVPSIEGNPQLNNAQGIFVTDTQIYVCDTDNSRILIYDKFTGEYSHLIDKPESKSLDADFIFKPASVAVDHENNLYIVSSGTYEGIINLDSQGEFLGFFATNKVSTSAWDLFWRRFSSIEQRKTMLQLVPQDFSSIDLDADGFFLITTSTAVSGSMVKRMNPGGVNVLQSQSNIKIVGDPNKTYSGTLAGKSSFCDISAGSEKIYACLDSTRGRIFCYSNSGYLLYTFGCLSDQLGGFVSPVALTYLNDERIAVLDTTVGSITVFNPTDYACAINLGIHYQNELEYEKAEEQWKYVLSQNSNYQMALNMIGRSYYNTGEYKTAMYYFQQAGNKSMYSAAWKLLRSEYIYKYAWVAVYLVIISAVALTIKFVFKKIKKKKAIGFTGR